MPDYMKNTTLYTSIVTKSLENSEISITGEIVLEAIDKFRPQVIKKLQKDFEIPGFRKGHVPEKVIVERLGEPTILEEIAELALQEVYPQIILEQKLDVVGPPQVSITKLAPGNPIEFSIKTATLPEVTLPDYKKIAEKVPSVEKGVTVDDKEVDSVIDQIQKSHTKGQSADDKTEDEQKPVQITDEFVKTLGDFENVADFKKKLKENILGEKVRKEKEKRRIEIGEKIIEGSTIPLPRIFVESELEKMLGQFKADIKKMGLEYETYLTQIKKTEDDVLKEWEKDAENRAKLQLILNKIAITENIHPDKEKLEHEVDHILSHMEGADPDRVRVYVETMLTNEEVFKLLEGTDEVKEKQPKIITKEDKEN